MAVRALDGLDVSLGAFDHRPPIDVTLGIAEPGSAALTKPLGEDTFRQTRFDPDRFLFVPEENPRFVPPEPRS
jgi:hypothetical protein